MSKYNPYDAIKMITDYKKQWTDANDAGNNEAKTRIATNAQSYYNQLIKNGYKDLADKLSASDYNGAEAIKNAYSTWGKSAIRPYYYEKGKQYGLSQNDIDNLLTYNNTTGDVTFGGKNIGKPYSVVDGTSYWDTDTLDNEWNDYVSRSGIGNSGVSNPAYNESMRKGTEKNDKLNETIYADKDKYSDVIYNLIGNDSKEISALRESKNSDPTQSAAYKSAFENIMPYYNYKGMQAGYNEAAKGSSSNGGNVDSFSAANAMRQQSALTAQGQLLAHQMGLDAYKTGKEASLEEYTARTNNIKDFLSQLGIINDNSYSHIENTRDFDTNQAQRYFDNTETYKNNEIKRDAAKKDTDMTMAERFGALTGYVPTDMTRRDNPYFKDGVLIDPTVDYEAIINDAKEKLKTETNSNVRAMLEKTINDANDARNEKMNDDRYAQFRGTKRATAPQTTADYAIQNKSLDNEYNINKMGIESSERVAGQSDATERYKTDKASETELENTRISAQNALDQIDAQTDANIRLMGSTPQTLTEDDIKIMDKAIDNINVRWKDYSGNGKTEGSDIIIKDGNGYYRLAPGIHERSFLDPIISDILSNQALTENEAAAIFERLGIDTDDIIRVQNYINNK